MTEENLNREKDKERTAKGVVASFILLVIGTAAAIASLGKHRRKI